MKNKPMRKILVLGAEGQIGKPVCRYFKNNGIKVYSIDLLNGSHHDLRKEHRSENSLFKYWMNDVDAVLFLAYDVGGAKFLAKKQNDYNFLRNNSLIMTNVFDAIYENKKPFIFASSAMAKMPWSSYGSLKLLGEHFTKSLGGVSVRFWNVYGPEDDNLKSHVITDFIRKAKTDKKIKMLTRGEESRQFLFAEDCAEALLKIFENYHEATAYEAIDVSSFKWTKVKTVAEIISQYYNVEIIPSDKKDDIQLDSHIEPFYEPISHFWNPDNCLSIEDGITRMIEHYEKNK